jgi:hypothetical protein
LFLLSSYGVRDFSFRLYFLSWAFIYAVAQISFVLLRIIYWEMKLLVLWFFLDPSYYCLGDSCSWVVLGHLSPVEDNPPKEESKKNMVTEAINSYFRWLYGVLCLFWLFGGFRVF